MSALTELYREVAVCQDCELARYRNRAVPGEGPEDADLFFIGEAPGWHEDQQGRPFVGPAGQFLDQLLASILLMSLNAALRKIVTLYLPRYWLVASGLTAR